MSDSQNGGIWLPEKSMWDSVFGSASAERAFLDVVTKAPSSKLSEIAALADAMGLVVKLKLEKKSEPKSANGGEPA